MRKSVGNQQSMIVQPCFLIGTYNADDTPNFAPITWVSITWCNDHYQLIISMNGTKQTKINAEANRKLSANLVSTDMLELMEYFGSRSGSTAPKTEVPYTFSPGLALAVPTLDVSKYVYECEVTQITVTGDTSTYFCKIVDVQCDASIDISEGIDLRNFDPVVYSGHYHAIGNHLGKIGDYYTPN
ncbi:MAG: flavin reductase family protein [Defluviitaleaceae bacterium]|nr:flavin reductase family protein [Defluviitaleaceae bacterium]